MPTPRSASRRPERLVRVRLAFLGLALVPALPLAGCWSLSRAAEPTPDQTPVPAASLAGAATPQPSPSAPPQTQRLVNVALRPLPGSLNRTPVFDSNSPEIIQESGIVLSTLPARAPGDNSVFLDHPFTGRFGVFSHHLARDARAGERTLFLGLVASNLGEGSAALEVAQGSTFLTQPDAPFVALPALVSNNAGVLFAGPGDRVATETVFERSSFPHQKWRVPGGEAALLYSLPIPANTAGEAPANGRTTRLSLISDRPLYLSEVALWAMRNPDGSFRPPSLADYLAALNRRVLAGRREAPASLYDPNWRVPEGFRYGRVCGVSEGDTWKGALFDGGAGLPQPGEAVGFPIASAFVKRFNTGQNQSARMLRRYGDTAQQSHANYGVTYELNCQLDNPEPAPRTYAFSLTTPARVAGDGPIKQLTYLDPPNAQVMFRGTVRTDWTDERGRAQRRFTHLVLRDGESVPPFQLLVVPPGASLPVTVRLNYPADATPPQLLTIGRL